MPESPNSKAAARDTKLGLLSITSTGQRLQIELDVDRNGTADRTIIAQENGFGFVLIPQADGTTINRGLDRKTASNIALLGKKLTDQGALAEVWDNFSSNFFKVSDMKVADANLRR